MELQVINANKQVEVWLAKGEQEEAAVQGYLQAIYTFFSAIKYTVVVYISGNGDLFQDTLALLRYNRRRSAERAVEAAKKSCQ